jgi:hypothetical protein
VSCIGWLVGCLKVEFYGVFFEPPSLGIMMEYCKFGSYVAPRRAPPRPALRSAVQRSAAPRDATRLD